MWMDSYGKIFWTFCVSLHVNDAARSERTDKTTAFRCDKFSCWDIGIEKYTKNIPLPASRRYVKVAAPWDTKFYASYESQDSVMMRRKIIWVAHDVKMATPRGAKFFEL